MKISIYGAGYVGLVTSACLASLGHDVLCVDINEERVNQLKNGSCPLFEKGLPELLREVVEKNRLSFTHQPVKAIQFANIHFIATGTPSDENGAADLSQVFAAVALIASEATDDCLIITKSTVPVNTGDEIEKFVQDIQKSNSNKISIKVASNPEFLREGSAVYDFLNADRIIVGGDEQSMEILSEVYQPLVKKGIPLLCMSRESAELSKYAANAMLASRISFMNQISRLAEAVNADIEDIRAGIGLDHRIGPHFLNAGIGYGGSCFPKDSRALIHKSRQLEIESSFIEAIEQINASQKKWAFHKLLDYFKGDLKGKKIALWGLSFKPGTDDMREASSLVIINKLLEAEASVCLYDPVAIENAQVHLQPNPNISWHDSKFATLEAQVDALVIVTEWDEFKQVDLVTLANKLGDVPLIDGRNCYRLADVEQSGIQIYISVGRPVVGAGVNFKNN